MKTIILTMTTFLMLTLTAYADSYSLNIEDTLFKNTVSPDHFTPQTSLGFSVLSDHKAYGSSPSSNGWTAVKVPEPATLLLLGSGLIGLASTVRRKNKNTYH